jgi:hypothetical protein
LRFRVRLSRKRGRGTARCSYRLEAAAEYLRAVADLSREDVIDLCERALRIDITLEEAERLWPDPPQDAEFAAIREDLLFGLGHVPGSRRHPDGDPERWRQCRSTTTSSSTFDDCPRGSRQHRRGALSHRVGCREACGAVRGVQDDSGMAQNFIGVIVSSRFCCRRTSGSGCREDHLAWLVIDAVGVMDTAGFYAVPIGGRARPRGLQTVDDDRAVVVLLVARGALVAGDRACLCRGMSRAG